MSRKAIASIISGVVLTLVCMITLSMWGCPRYKIWQREQRGKATLAEAEWDRKIAVQEAEAKLEAADLLSKAEVKRAEGVAEANKIIGESLKENEGYLQYLWIQGLQDGSSEVIYIPTEANMPILEARPRARRTTGGQSDG